jgi:lipid-binding SYLF domain-containing protein
MKKTTVIAALAAVFCCFSFSNSMALDEAARNSTSQKQAKATKTRNDATKISKASKVVKEIAAIPKKKIPPDLLSGASAVVVVPGAAKNDFMASGGSAGGVLLVHDKEGKWSSPVFITISGGTLGWQIVSDHIDIILVFKNRTTVDALMKGKLDLNARIAIAPGRLAPSMKAATPAEMKAEVASYVRSRGTLLEEAVVAGTTLQIDAAANDVLYAMPKVDVRDIVSGKVVMSTEDVKALQKQLTDYVASK